MKRNRNGFTLPELLVVIVIIAVVSAASLPTIVDAYQSRSVRSGAAVTQAAVVQARSLSILAQTRHGVGAEEYDKKAGIRLVPDEAWPIARRPDGTIDPTRPIAYSRTLPIEQPPHYHTGLVEVHAEGFPAEFTPLPGRLVLEESLFGADGLRAEPTTWAWNVRAGDTVYYLERPYTVSGPLAIPVGPENPDGYVNYGLPGAATPLDRGAGPIEWLYLTNHMDDDDDGATDEGWDGLDNDLDGLIDEDDEWEAEVWDRRATARPTPYRIERRPVVAELSRSSILPAPVVIDATGWTRTGLGSRLRSQVPIDPYTGTVDVLFDGTARVVTPNVYGRESSYPLGRPWIHLWIADRGDVKAPVGANGYAYLVSINRDTGLVQTTTADAFDPEATIAAAERGTR